ncbi:MAG TPA: PQQ-dependent catabolism-associated CXXCW motif protein [Terriglobales bacterium]|nr:PQQ-dependent catabolism-associated CXXCW motif protein [Terriglobales bacterium]
MKRWAPLQFLLATIAIGAAEYGWAADTVPEPAGYRLDDYRGPTPASLKGASVLDASTLYHLMLTKPLVVIDVLPQPPRPANLPSTTLWHPPTRLDIPGSIWLANTGYGQLSPEMDSYFRKALAGLTLGDMTHPLAFYCEAQCWMSWNAAKRAFGYGYKHVYWFPGGVQAWHSTGYPMLPNLPLPPK